ncbi:hypothetical protein TRIUR3_28731 [Triticum urartu]|uniref:Ubiquitinyl hydrolase variant UBP zinc finger domain-containing protein n=1 Tax=Triticum urartu TaxID=4572 RepID=M7YJS8_TRIUA|nr:hypothetical protein TRIUR3_28731 [Triticum urartu]
MEYTINPKNHKQRRIVYLEIQVSIDRNLHFGSESDDSEKSTKQQKSRNLHVWCLVNLLKEVGWRLYVDMNLFLGFGREHVPRNFKKTENHVYLHVVQWQKPNRNEPENPLKKPLYSPSYAGAKVICRTQGDTEELLSSH